MTFIRHSVSLWNDLGDPVFDGAELTGFNGRASVSLLTMSSTIFFVLSMGRYRLSGDFRLIGCLSLSPSRAFLSYFNSNNNKDYCPH